MIRRALSIATFLAALTPVPAALATETPLSDTLRVGTKLTAPFAFLDDGGRWQGISIELWESLAARQGWSHRYVELQLDELVEALRDGQVDVVVAAVTVTAEREKRVDFTHPFYSTGLGIAIAARDSGWRRVARMLLSPPFVRVVLSLSLLLLAVGLLVWWFERRGNAEQFGGGALRGIGSGFWWSAVTMTTVGYGDKAPRTVPGRLLGLVWMFASILMISSFTAAVTSTMTMPHLAASVRGPEDLGAARVAAVAGTAPLESLRRRGVVARPFASVPEALQALVAGGVDAVVHDAPILRYHVNQRHAGDLEVLARTFERQDYAFVLPEGSPLRELLNPPLLEQLRHPDWERRLERYLGR